MKKKQSGAVPPSPKRERERREREVRERGEREERVVREESEEGETRERERERGERERETERERRAHSWSGQCNSFLRNETSGLDRVQLSRVRARPPDMLSAVHSEEDGAASPLLKWPGW